MVYSAVSKLKDPEIGTIWPLSMMWAIQPVLGTVLTCHTPIFMAFALRSEALEHFLLTAPLGDNQ